MAARNRNTVPWKVYVPAELALKIELRYCGPSGRPDYGARSHLVVALLREFERVTQATEVPIDFMNNLISRLIRESEEEEKKRHEQSS